MRVPHRSAGHVMPPVKFLRSASLPFSEPAFNCATMKRHHRLSSGEQSKHLCSFGKKGHKPGNLNTPTGIAATKTGKMHCVYICKETRCVIHHSDIGCFDSIQTFNLHNEHLFYNWMNICVTAKFAHPENSMLFFLKRNDGTAGW